MATACGAILAAPDAQSTLVRRAGRRRRPGHANCVRAARPGHVRPASVLADVFPAPAHVAVNRDRWPRGLRDSGRAARRQVTKSVHLEGKVFFAPYSNPNDRSALEIYRNYEQELKKVGFQTLFACNGAECGGDTERDTVKPQFYSTQDSGWSNRYLAARLSRPEGDVYVSLLGHAQGRVGGGTDLYVIEVKPMENKNL